MQQVYYYEQKRAESRKNRFEQRMKDKIGMPYYLSGGLSATRKGQTNLDANGNWLGFDCIGGIAHSLGIWVNDQNAFVKKGLKEGWLSEIKESDLRAGDVILADIDPKLYGGNHQGRWDHIMTYIGKQGDGNDIITTAIGGDTRFDPPPQGSTQYRTLEGYKTVQKNWVAGYNERQPPMLSAQARDTIIGFYRINFERLNAVRP